MKTKIFNLIILDESGSMSDTTKQTISGCNETINTIIAAQNEHADTQEHCVSIYAFQSCGSRPSRYLLKNVPALNAKHITENDYVPFGSTPLFDAVGSTLADLKMCTSDLPAAVGSVTIITDGYENASKSYSLSKVAMMIDQLKELGWNFNFIGANIDVTMVAKSLSIDNVMEFTQDDEGVKCMYDSVNASRKAYYEELCYCANTNSKDFREKAKQASKGFFSKK